MLVSRLAVSANTDNLVLYASRVVVLGVNILLTLKINKGRK